MANSLLLNPQGPVWPLGSIKVLTPGTPVNIMSLVDPTSLNAPETATPSATGPAGSDEYTRRAYAIIFSGLKSGGATRLSANSGTVYVILKPLAAAGGSSDVGVIVIALRSTDAPFLLTAPALDHNIFNLYEFYIDADQANDCCQVTALIG